MKKILIAGGSGFTGGFLLRELSGKSHIEAVGRKASSHKYAEGIRFTQCDFSKSDDRLCLNSKNYDTAIFLAQSDCHRQLPDKAEELFSVNAMGFIRFLEAARRARVKHVIYASSGSVYGSTFSMSNENDFLCPSDLYGLSKKMGEEVLSHYEPYFKTTVLRIVYVYGDGQADRFIPNLIKRIRDGEDVLLQKAAHEDDTTEGFVTNPIYVGDAVKIIHKIIDNEICGTYNVSGNEALSVKQIADIIGGHLGVKPKFKITNEERRGNFLADNKKMKGFYNEWLTPFSDGVKRTIGFSQ